MNNKTFKAWITKYALTQGIYEIEAKLCDDVDASGDMIEKVVHPGEYSDYFHGKGREWHETKKGAIAYAGELRRKKIASLKKQIAKLEGLKFV